MAKNRFSIDKNYRRFIIAAFQEKIPKNTLLIFDTILDNLEENIFVDT